MGYTYEGKKAVIWTQKVFVADKWPFNDEGENYTRFYSNLRNSKHFFECLARLSEEEKKELISKEINLNVNSFILKSKKIHYKTQYKK